MEEKWTELFDDLEDIVLLIDHEYHIRKINKKGQKAFNISREVAPGHTCYAVLWGKNAPCHYCPVHQSNKTGEAAYTEQYLDLNEGKWFSIKSTPIFDKNNHPEGYIDILRDISPLKEKEKELKEKNEEYLAANEELKEWGEEVNQLNDNLKKLNHEYELVSTNSSDMVSSYDNQFNLQFISGSVRSFTGYSPEEYRSLTPDQLVHKKDYKRFLRFISSFKTTIKTSQTFRFRLRHKTRGVIWIEIIVRYTNNNGEQLWVVNHRDISKRKEAEDQLAFSNQKFKALYENAPIPYQSLDKNGRFLDVNPAWLRQLGYEKDEIEGQSFHTFLHPESQVVFTEEFPFFNRNGRIEGVEYKIRNKKGHFLDVIFEGRIGYTPDGEVKQIYCVFRDVTEHKKLQQKLEDREIRLSHIFKYMTNGMAVYEAIDNGHHFRFKEFNDTACKITNTTRDMVIGKTLLDVFPLMDDSPLLDALRKVYLTGESLYLEPFYYKDNTREGWRENHIYKLPSGEIVALFADVTQLMEGKEKLKEQNEEYLALNEELTQTNEELYAAKERAEESEMEFRELFENLSQGFALHEVIFNENGEPVDYRFVHINRAFEKINHVQASDLIGKCVKEVLPKTEDYWIRNFGEVAMTGEPMHFENYACEFDKYYEVVAYCPRKGYFAVIFSDITSSKKHEKELKAAKDKAEESDRLKSAFLANMSHEIRTPMNAILGFSELLNNPEISAKKRKKYTSVIKETGHQLLHIINDVLDISKIESGNIQIEQQPFNLYQTVNEAIIVYHPQVSEKVKLALDFNLHQDLSFPGDKNRISQILHNLLSNAVKFTDRGQITLECTLQKQTLVLRVKDTGRGINKENLNKVFERFWQEKTELEENKGGTGLGLAISQQLAKKMGGSITVDSTKNKGSIFSLHLPYQPIQQITSKDNLPTSTKTTLSENISRKILIAEDEEVNFLFLTELLSIKKHTIIRARNGQEVITLAQEQPAPDLILMDIKMPVMDGTKAMVQIKKAGINAPVIALTAYAMKEDKEKFLKMGFDDYLSKPVNIDLLFKKIDQYL